MKLFRKIDTQTGNFIEDVLFDSHPFLTEIIAEEITLEDSTTETIETVVTVLDDEGNTILDPQYIAEPVPQGFYLPRWNGEAWEEGATQEYIDSLKAQPQEPTETERIETLEQALLEIVLEGVF